MLAKWILNQNASNFSSMSISVRERHYYSYDVIWNILDSVDVVLSLMQKLLLGKGKFTDLQMILEKKKWNEKISFLDWFGSLWLCWVHFVLLSCLALYRIAMVPILWPPFLIIYIILWPTYHFQRLHCAIIIASICAKWMQPSKGWQRFAFTNFSNFSNCLNSI